MVGRPSLLPSRFFPFTWRGPSTWLLKLVQERSSSVLEAMSYMLLVPHLKSEKNYQYRCEFFPQICHFICTEDHVCCLIFMVPSVDAGIPLVLPFFLKKSHTILRFRKKKYVKSFHIDLGGLLTSGVANDGYLFYLQFHTSALQSGQLAVTRSHLVMQAKLYLCPHRSTASSLLYCDPNLLHKRKGRLSTYVAKWRPVVGRLGTTTN